MSDRLPSAPPGVTCEQSGCAEEAAGAFMWPGASLRAACARHLGTARRVAAALGFTVAEYPLAMREAELAVEASRVRGFDLDVLLGDREGRK